MFFVLFYDNNNIAVFNNWLNSFLYLFVVFEL